MLVPLMRMMWKETLQAGGRAMSPPVVRRSYYKEFDLLTNVKMPFSDFFIMNSNIKKNYNNNYDLLSHIKRPMKDMFNIYSNIKRSYKEQMNIKGRSIDLSLIEKIEKLDDINSISKIKTANLVRKKNEIDYINMIKNN
jgi:hypothetical protein